MEEQNINILTEDQISEISEFAVRKREQIMRILWEDGELTQGDLAQRANSTPTSMSNILLKFDQFKYKLLCCESRGIRKFYSLSDTGAFYMRYLNNKTMDKRDIVNANDLYLFQEAKNSIKYFRDKADGDNEILMEDALLRLCYGIDNESSCEDIDVLLKYIYSIEKLLLLENEVYFERAMRLMESEILRKRVDQFLEGFYLLRPILDLLEDQDNILDVYDMMEFAVKGSEEDVSRIANERGWNIPCAYIVQFFRRIKQVGKSSRKHIFKMIMGYLPDKAELSAMITQLICTDK